MTLISLLLVAAALIGIGLYGALSQQSFVMLMMGLELMLNGVLLAAVGFWSLAAGGAPAGQLLVIITMAVMAVEMAVGFALRPKPISVDLVTATRGLLRVTLDEEGETRARDRFLVSAPLAGRVLRINLEPGDAVEANRTVLATLLP